MQRTFHAIIFDMDGVIVDSEYWWQRWEKNFLPQVFGAWSEKQQQNTMGKSLKDIVTNLFGTQQNTTITKEEFWNHYNQAAEQIYQKQCRLMPHLREVLAALTNANLKIGLASSALPSWVAMVIQRFALTKYFHAIVSAQDVNGLSKPAPDIYLFTAKKLAIPPENCLVIEDANHGITAAKAAGMYTVAYQTPYNKLQNLTRADTTITDLIQLLPLVSQQHL